ncbi:MAG: hypothetical protein FJ252_02230 [Phycisphaerae bacterium]|nr:hypothetical protein [Phycisphaerae bacterium]
MTHRSVAPIGPSVCVGLAVLGALAVVVGLVVPVLQVPALHAGGEAPIGVASNPWAVATATVLWSLGAGAAVTALGWWMARMCTPRGWFSWICWIVPVLVPPYAAWYAWWQLGSPEFALGAWIIEQDAVGAWRVLSLALALACTLWPIAGALVLGLRERAMAREATAMDRLRWIDRGRLAWREDRHGVMLSVLVLGGLTMADTTAFDLALVRTVGFELRALEAAGASPWSVLMGSMWSIAAALGVAIVITRPRASDDHATAQAPRSARWPLGLLAATLVVPGVVLMIMSLGQGGVVRVMQVYGGGVLRTAAAAVVCGALIAGVCMLHAWLAEGSAWMRCAERWIRVAWITLALSPAVVIAVAHVQAWNRDGLSWMHDGLGIVAAAQLSRWGWIGAVLGWLAVRSAPSDMRASARLDGRAWTVVLALLPRIGVACVAAGAIGAVGAAGEVIVSARVQPPGGEWIASALLNAMHYQRPDVVAGFVPILMLVAAVAAVALAGLMRRFGGMTLASVAVLPFMVACGGEPQPSMLPKWCADARIVGRGGKGPLQFNYPRAMAWTPAGELIIIDRSARVQVLGADGSYRREWMMPEFDQGFPTGVSVSPEGEVWVADTHEHRITVMDDQGRLLRTFGKFGQEPGQFVFPTDIAFGDDGLVYVSEYGGNDRIQVFGRDGTFVRAFGHHGVPGDDSPEPKFDRPQSLIMLGSGRLLVADACNHRLVELTTDGAFVRSIGAMGQEPGELLYPYGLELLDEATVLVTEFGGCRLQAFDLSNGASMGCLGKGGREPGMLNGPWTTQVHGATMAVLDSTNNRLYLMPSDRWIERARRESGAVP